MNRKARRERALAQSHLFRRYGKGRWIRPQRFENSAGAL